MIVTIVVAVSPEEKGAMSPKSLDRVLTGLTHSISEIIRHSEIVGAIQGFEIVVSGVEVQINKLDNSMPDDSNSHLN